MKPIKTVIVHKTKVCSMSVEELAKHHAAQSYQVLKNAGLIPDQKPSDYLVED